MADFEKMYFALFNAVTDALKAFRACDPERAVSILEKAQCAGEESYIKTED